jgi:hypothetical protein
LKRKIMLSAGGVVLLSSLSGCAFFDNEARDRAACDRLSDVITEQNVDNLTEATPSFMSRVESEVLPLASGALGGHIRDLLDSYENTQDGSIFDQFAGGIDGLAYADAILARCFEVSSSLY